MFSISERRWVHTWAHTFFRAPLNNFSSFYILLKSMKLHVSCSCTRRTLHVSRIAPAAYCPTFWYQVVYNILIFFFNIHLKRWISPLFVWEYKMHSFCCTEKEKEKRWRIHTFIVTQPRHRTPFLSFYYYFYMYVYVYFIRYDIISFYFPSASFFFAFSPLPWLNCWRLIPSPPLSSSTYHFFFFFKERKKKGAIHTHIHDTAPCYK